ncbi:spindle pole body component 110-like [Rhodamnia argentea]|uniref:Spindle pole body component 110-like n=1 Tax=Rhodamnia argentea TaxID=178133 RepID=A0ABM3H4V6_9MYRT|nr:spindle pole body component 110-like [Rhodamnia argentea]
MSRDPHDLSTRGGNVNEVPNGSVPDLVASLRLAVRPAEDFEKVLASVEGKWKLDIEKNKALRKEREVLKASLEAEEQKSGALREENKRLRGEIARLENKTREAEATQRGHVEMLEEETERLRAEIAWLEDEMRKGEARGREEAEMLEDKNRRLCGKIASLEEEMRKGETRGGEVVEMLEEENVRVRRSEELVREIRRVLELDRAVGVLRNEEEMKNVEGEKGVPCEANCFDMKREDGGDDIGAPKGTDSRCGCGSSSSSRKARKMLEFGEGTCASATTTPVGSDDKSLGKETLVSQGDGRVPLKEVEACNVDDDVAESRHLSRSYLSHQKPAVGMHLDESNQESEKRELKRKRDSIAHEKDVGSGTTKLGDGSCLHGGAWKNAKELYSDLGRDYELCMKAICALYKRKKLAWKAMGRSSKGFSGLRLLRGNHLAEFLTDGDPQCRLKKSVEDLQDHCPGVLQDCQDIATEHCHQLFEMYQQKEDPFL